MSRYTRDYAKASSGFYKGWAPSKSTFYGWSKRATPGYYCHEWGESIPRGPDKTKGVQPETGTDAEVAIVDDRDKNQRKVATNDAVGSTTANTTAEKDARMRRLGELHRLLNSRKGSLNATYKKNTKANDKAHDLNGGTQNL